MNLTYTYSLRLIIPFVFGLHMILGISLLLVESERKMPLPKKVFAVKSVKLMPRTEQAPLASKSQGSEAPTAKVQPSVTQKIEETKPIKKEVKKTPAAKPAAPTVPKPKTPPKPEIKDKVTKKSPPKESKGEVKGKSQEWIAKAKEKISKIGPISSTIAESSLKNVQTPTSIDTFLSDLTFEDSGPVLNAKESSYREELAHRLKLHLKLPEYGDVEIKLTVGRSGKVIDVKILKAKSKKNAGYLEKEVPKILLPGFGNNFAGQDTFDFTIRMSNE